MNKKSYTLDELRAMRSDAASATVKRKHTDHEGTEQKHLLSWMKVNNNPVIRSMAEVVYHVPNGGTRNGREAANLKEQGTRAGVSDLVIPMARGGYFGLYLELKATPPHNSMLAESQQGWLLKVHRNGYAAALAVGKAEAQEIIDRYASMPPTLTTVAMAGESPSSIGGTDWFSVKTSKPAKRRSRRPAKKS